MKYLCLGYMNEETWNARSDEEREAIIADCFAYDRVLRDGDHMVDGFALQTPYAATTVQSSNEEVTVTDGPFAETKEQLGGFFIMEANDLNHAIQLISKHPGLKIGPFEVRAIDEEFTAQVDIENAGTGEES